VQESLPLILMQVLVGLKHGKTLYPEISDLGNAVIHKLVCVYVHNYLF